MTRNQIKQLGNMYDSLTEVATPFAPLKKYIEEEVEKLCNGLAALIRQIVDE